MESPGTGVIEVHLEEQSVFLSTEASLLPPKEITSSKYGVEPLLKLAFKVGS